MARWHHASCDVPVGVYAKAGSIGAKATAYANFNLTERQPMPPTACAPWHYTLHSNMIKSFKHKGLQLFFESGSKAGIQPGHAPRLSRQITRLNESKKPEDMAIHGWNLHLLKDESLKGHYSIWVNGNWRMTFKFEGDDAVLVDYQDYH